MGTVSYGILGTYIRSPERFQVLTYSQAGA
jgi:hypothetical protein